MISFKSSYENTFASVAEAAAINSKGTKTRLANALSKFPFKFKPVFNNGSKILLRNLPNCIMLDN